MVKHLATSVLLLLLLGLSVTACAFLSVDRWVLVALDPGRFEPASTPPEPDYTQRGAWAAMPTTDDDADISLAALPAGDQTSAPVDVFFVHPTTWMGPQWNGPIDDPEVIGATARGATLIQASAFNACCAIYAPRYRQANGEAFVEPSKDGEQAKDVAYGDIRAAFDLFVERHNKDRPFILASHSQGSAHSARLLREHIWGKPVAQRMVAAYLLGGPVTQQTLGPGVPVCGAADQTGCVVAFNARGPLWEDSALEFASLEGEGPSDKMSGRLCVNPLNWRSDDRAALSSSHAGALFFDTDAPTILPRFAAARCREGRLVVSEIGELPSRDSMSGLLLWILGPQNYHPIEYQLFYVNIRRNAATRIEAFSGREAQE